MLVFTAIWIRHMHHKETPNNAYTHDISPHIQATTHYMSHNINETYGRFSTLEGSTTVFLGACFFLFTAGVGALRSVSESSSAAKKLDWKILIRCVERRGRDWVAVSVWKKLQCSRHKKCIWCVANPQLLLTTPNQPMNCNQTNRWIANKWFIIPSLRTLYRLHLT